MRWFRHCATVPLVTAETTPADGRGVALGLCRGLLAGSASMAVSAAFRQCVQRLLSIFLRFLPMSFQKHDSFSFLSMHH